MIGSIRMMKKKIVAVVVVVVLFSITTTIINIVIRRTVGVLGTEMDRMMAVGMVVVVVVVGSTEGIRVEVHCSPISTSFLRSKS